MFLWNQKNKKKNTWDLSSVWKCAWVWGAERGESMVCSSFLRKKNPTLLKGCTLEGRPECHVIFLKGLLTFSFLSCPAAFLPCRSRHLRLKKWIWCENRWQHWEMSCSSVRMRRRHWLPSGMTSTHSCRWAKALDPYRPCGSPKHKAAAYKAQPALCTSCISFLLSPLSTLCRMPHFEPLWHGEKEGTRR